MSLTSLCFLFILILSSTALAQDFTGTIKKNNVQETVSFDLTIGDQKLNYTVKGSTKTDKGYVKSELDFSYIKVTKNQITADGRTFVKEFDNKGKIYVYARERKIGSDEKDAPKVVLAGIPVAGEFVQGFFDDGLKLVGMTIDGTQSKGKLDYNSANGHYNAKGDCQFGDCCITSSEDGKCVFDYDDYNDQNAMEITLAFGDLRLNGTINFTDTTKAVEVSSGSDENDDDTTISHEVIATEGKINARLTNADGTALQLADLSQQKDETATEKNLRKMIVFFELLSYDMCSE